MTDTAAGRDPDDPHRWRPPPWLEATSGLSWRLLVMAGAALLVVLVLVGLHVVVVPLVFGFFLSAAVAPIHGRLVGRGMGRGGASGICVLVFFVGGLATAWLVLRAVIGPVDDIAHLFTEGVDRLDDRVASLAGNGGVSDATAAGREAIGTAASTLVHGVLGVAGVVASVGSTMLLSLLVLFFFLKDGPSIWAWMISFSGDNRPLVDGIGLVVWGKVAAYIRGTAAVAGVDAVGIGLGALVLGTPFVGAIAIITFLFAFIPYYGALVAGAIAVMLALADGGFGEALAMLAIVLVVQQLESNLLQPLLVGKAVRLHPLVVALGVIAGGAVAGVLGMFLAVPVIASVAAALSQLRDAGAFASTRLATVMAATQHPDGTPEPGV